MLANVWSASVVVAVASGVDSGPDFDFGPGYDLDFDSPSDSRSRSSFLWPVIWRSRPAGC